MRVDKFLNVVNIVKNRTKSQDMIKHKVVFINDKIAKTSSSVKCGDEVRIDFLDKRTIFKVLQIPISNSTKKDDIDKYIQFI